ncbi:endonuclease/exonuclease/phosphatase family protein [Verrucomicrobiota bacterium]
MNEKIPGFLRLCVSPWGLLTAAGVVACSATLFGFLGRFSWFLDLFSHFRVQYLLGLCILGFVFLAARRRRTAAVFIAFACINLTIVLPLYFGSQAPAPEATRTLRAMLLNVNTHFGDAERVRQIIQEVNPDILVLEEISSQWVLDLRLLANSYPHSRLQPREDNFGIGLFSKLPFAEGKVVYIGDADVPSIVATVDAGQGKLRVIATHPLPPAGAAYSRWRNDQLERLPDYVRSSLPLVLLGDLNVTPWNYHFRRLLKRTGLIDSSQGQGIQPTWPNYNPLLLIPIDHCLHSPDICVVSKKIGRDVGSDHYPVIIDFAIKIEQDGNGPAKGIQGLKNQK